MRQPSTYDWHAASLRGERPAVHEDEPHVGWFRTRLVRHGPWCPARIWCEQEIDPETGELLTDERMLCEVDGDRRNPARAWTWLASNPISEAAFNDLCHLRHLDPRMRASLVRYDLTREPMRP
jgi:hypothetical protein